MLGANAESASVNPIVTLPGNHAHMVIRPAIRAVLFPLLLLTVSGATASYFVWHAINGQRGIKAKEDYLAQMETLQVERATLLREKTALERRVALLRDKTIDRELLEEEARRVLGRVHRNDVVIFLPKENSRPRDN